MQLTKDHLGQSISKVKNYIDNGNSIINNEVNNIKTNSILGKELDYGMYRIDSSVISKIDGNIECNTDNMSIILKKDIRYFITGSVKCYMSSSASGWRSIYVTNINTNENIHVIPVGLTGSSWTIPAPISFIYQPEEDCEITISGYAKELGGYISVTQISKQILNTEELDYLYLTTNNRASYNNEEYVPFKNYMCGNMEYDLEKFSVKLKANKTYKLTSTYFCSFSAANGYIQINYKNITTGEDINNTDSSQITSNADNSYANSLSTMTMIYTPEEDCEVGVYINFNRALALFYNANFIVEEIGRTVIPENNINQDVLFDGFLLPANGQIGKIELNGNISDYKYLYFLCAAQHSGYTTYINPYSGVVDVASFTSDNIQNSFNFSLTGDSDAFRLFTIVQRLSDTSINILTQNSSSATSSTGWVRAGLVKVIGIR